jgi:hypothetical protein
MFSIFQIVDVGCLKLAALPFPKLFPAFPNTTLHQSTSLPFLHQHSTPMTTQLTTSQIKYFFLTGTRKARSRLKLFFLSSTSTRCQSGPVVPTRGICKGKSLFFHFSIDLSSID